jgi:hypothetical protein
MRREQSVRLVAKVAASAVKADVNGVVIVEAMKVDAQTVPLAVLKTQRQFNLNCQMAQTVKPHKLLMVRRLKTSAKMATTVRLNAGSVDHAIVMDGIAESATQAMKFKLQKTHPQKVRTQRLHL